MSGKEKSDIGKPGEKQAEKGKSSKNLIIMAFSAIAVIAVVAVVFQWKGTSERTSSPVPVVEGQSLRKGETRETLSPSVISDPYIASVYQVAKDIPHVLDSLKCYCNCESAPFHHKSLLSCYVDRHAEA